MDTMDEEEAYDLILACFERAALGQVDAAVAAGRLAAKLARDVSLHEPGLRNSLLLLVDLFLARAGGVDLRGTDIRSLCSSEQAEALRIIESVFV